MSAASSTEARCTQVRHHLDAATSAFAMSLFSEDDLGLGQLSLHVRGDDQENISTADGAHPDHTPNRAEWLPKPCRWAGCGMTPVSWRSLLVFGRTNAPFPCDASEVLTMIVVIVTENERHPVYGACRPSCLHQALCPIKTWDRRAIQGHRIYNHFQG